MVEKEERGRKRPLTGVGDHHVHHELDFGRDFARWVADIFLREPVRRR